MTVKSHVQYYLAYSLNNQVAIVEMKMHTTPVGVLMYTVFDFYFIGHSIKSCQAHSQLLPSFTYVAEGVCIRCGAQP